MLLVTRDKMNPKQCAADFDVEKLLEKLVRKVTDTLADKIKIVVQEVKTEMYRFVVQGIKSKLLRRRLCFNVLT